MSGLDDLEGRVAELRRSFVEGLPQRRASLASVRETLLAGRSETRAALAALAHKLRGSAGSYGFDELSVLAASVEVGSERLPSVELDARVARLLELLDAVIAGAAPAPSATDEASSRRAAAAQEGGLGTPEQPGKSAPSRVAVAPSGPAEAAAAAPARVRVLALDDDEPTRRLLTVCLRPASGFETVVVARWREALERARADRFDLVLTDWMMPDGDGLAFSRALRAAGGASAGSPVVVLSAAAAPAGLALGSPGQPMAWIQKPFAARALVEQLLALARAARASSGR